MHNLATQALDQMSLHSIVLHLKESTGTGLVLGGGDRPVPINLSFLKISQAKIC
jgi:hypothetical protein